MKYRKKEREVEAFQMTKEARLCPMNWPGWLYKAWIRPADQLWSLNPASEEDQKDLAITDGEEYAKTRMEVDDNTGTLMIRSLEDYDIVEHGDYIVKGDYGGIYAWPRKTFERNWEPA